MGESEGSDEGDQANKMVCEASTVVARGQGCYLMEQRRASHHLHACHARRSGNAGKCEAKSGWDFWGPRPSKAFGSTFHLAVGCRIILVEWHH